MSANKNDYTPGERKKARLLEFLHVAARHGTVVGWGLVLAGGAVLIAAVFTAYLAVMGKGLPGLVLDLLAFMFLAATSVMLLALGWGIQKIAESPVFLMEDALPERITLKPIGEQEFPEQGDPGFFGRISEDLARLGFKYIGMYTIPEMAYPVVFMAAHHPGRHVYATVVQMFKRDVKGGVGNEAGRYLEMVSVFADASSLTTTTMPRGMMETRPPQLACRVMPGAGPEELLAGHLSEREGLSARPEPTSAAGFKSAFLQGYYIERAFRKARGWVTPEEVAEMAREHGFEKHADLAAKIVRRGDVGVSPEKEDEPGE